MARTRTFLDANVLIHAFRGTGQLTRDAQDVIDDDTRDFVVSDILRLELIPKSHFNRQFAEEQFYKDYFSAAVTVIQTTPELVQDAETEAKSNGLSAADALHITAAKQGRVDEFITTEKSTKPLFRVQGMVIQSLLL